MQWMVWLGLGVTALLLVLAFVLVRLPGGSGTRGGLPVYGTVGDFTLTNQQGNSFGLGDLKGKVWVTDIIFTRCPGPCLTMTRHMKALQDGLDATSQVKLVSLTTDPDFDTPEVLAQYAQRFKADAARWTFLTGSKKQIADLATGSLKFTAIDKKPAERQSPEDLFVHSTIFILVDKQARIRGIFETLGDDVNPQEVRERILDGARKLERER